MDEEVEIAGLDDVYDEDEGELEPLFGNRSTNQTQQASCA